MDINGGISNTNTFITVYWHIRVIFLSMHCDGQLRGVWVFHGTCLNESMLHIDNMGIESSLVVWIRVRWEYKRPSINNNSVDFRGFVQIK